MRMWGGRFSEENDARVADFTRSVEVDAALALDDLAGSIEMLRNAGLEPFLRYLLVAAHAHTIPVVMYTGDGAIDQSEALDILRTQCFKRFSVDIVGGDVGKVLRVEIFDQRFEILILSEEILQNLLFLGEKLLFHFVDELLFHRFSVPARRNWRRL